MSGINPGKIYPTPQCLSHWQSSVSGKSAFTLYHWVTSLVTIDAVAPRLYTLMWVVKVSHCQVAWSGKWSYGLGQCLKIFKADLATAVPSPPLSRAVRPSGFCPSAPPLVFSPSPTHVKCKLKPATNKVTKTQTVIWLWVINEKTWRWKLHIYFGAAVFVSWQLEYFFVKCCCRFIKYTVSVFVSLFFLLNCCKSAVWILPPNTPFPWTSYYACYIKQLRNR